MPPEHGQGTSLVPPETSVLCRMCGASCPRTSGEVDGYTFVECPACAFTFCPSLTADGLKGLYADGFHGADEGAPEEGWASVEPTFLDVALDRLGDDRPLEVLDFGTGESRTPDHLRRMGHHVLALDVSPPRTPHPDRLVGDLLEVGLPERRFDLAYAFQVFEHLPEPRPYLDELLRVTRPGGYVLVHTDMETPERKEGLEDWWYVLPPDHNAFYRHRTFEHYLRDTHHELVHRDEKRVLIRRD